MIVGHKYLVHDVDSNKEGLVGKIECVLKSVDFPENLHSDTKLERVIWKRVIVEVSLINGL